MLSIFTRFAYVVLYGRSHAFEEGLDAARVEGLFGSVGRDAERLAQEHGGVLGKELANDLDLPGRVKLSTVL